MASRGWRSGTPPSVLPDISPTRGRESGIANVRMALRQSPPLRRRCPAGQRGARSSAHPSRLALAPIHRLATRGEAQVRAHDLPLPRHRRRHHQLFAARNTHAVDVAVLQPADPFLDMAGEDLRRRIFLTESETGASLCLRPEFTIPVCLDHIASQAGTPRRYSYLGEVFRQRRDGGNEFFQAGIEDLGDRTRPKPTPARWPTRMRCCRWCCRARRCRSRLATRRIFEAVLAALGLPRGWRMRLVRAFGSAPMLRGSTWPISPTRPATASSPAPSLHLCSTATWKVLPRTSPAAWKRRACRRRPGARLRTSRGG